MTLWKVTGYTVGGLLLLISAGIFGVEALFVLNQDLQIVPTRVSVFINSVNGYPVSNGVIAASLFLLATGCTLSGTILIGRPKEEKETDE